MRWTVYERYAFYPTELQQTVSSVVTPFFTTHQLGSRNGALSIRLIGGVSVGECVADHQSTQHCANSPFNARALDVLSHICVFDRVEPAIRKTFSAARKAVFRKPGWPKASKTFRTKRGAQGSIRYAEREVPQGTHINPSAWC